MRDEKAWKWLGENQLSYDIWEMKYRYNNESFDEWLDRITGGNKIYKELVKSKKFLPAGRILSNRGLHKDGIKVTYSNCYVQQPPEDSIESIFDTAKEMARTFSYGGGVGVDISKLAPRGAKVNNTAKETSGAVSFMDLYSMITGLIGQNGRRGALMISLDCHHPDLEEFIEIKNDLSKVTKANISIRITDDFMNAVIDDTDFELSYHRDETNEKISKTVRARDIFHKLCESNWDYAEPGMLFWDSIENWNLLSNDANFHYDGTNPCAEEPLPAGGSCLLGSLNLAEFVIEPFTNEARVDIAALKKSVSIAVEYLNDILNEGIELHPLEMQRAIARQYRQIGLGIMGLADMLIKLGIKYGSKEAIDICDKIATTIQVESIKKSSNLAKFNGTYPAYHSSVIDTDYFRNIPLSESEVENVKQYGLRNSQLLTIAPTGTLSTMLGVSGGIEPIFAKSYTRKTESLKGYDEYYKVYTPIVKDYMDKFEIDDDANLPEYFTTSPEIDYKNRIKMQAVFQNHIDASISSTINVPNDFTVEQVKDLYIEAWKAGLKGVTVYRDGCKRNGILIKNDNNRSKKNEVQTTIDSLPRGFIVDVSDDLIGYKRKLDTGCGSIHMEVYCDEMTGEPQETFINIGSSGGCERNYQFISRLISLALRSGVPIEAIVDQARSIRPCTAYINRTKTKGDTSPGTSCPSAIGIALQELYFKIHDGMYIETTEEHLPQLESSNCPICEDELDEIFKKEPEAATFVAVCPECGQTITHEGGCNICKNCGWSKCD
ncbi:adenosylcobalamin-dependent ribonucleoside-diphosphate reductase [Anaerovoracaceae bacterium 41-7]